MSQDNELSNIIRDRRHMDTSPSEPSDEEWSDMHSRIIQLPRTDRRQLYKVKKYVPLEEVLDWQQTCPRKNPITDVGTNTEEEIRIALETNKRVAIWRGKANIIECDAVLMDDWLLHICLGSDTRNAKFTISRGFRSAANYIYYTPRLCTDDSTAIEFLTAATQSGCRSMVIDLDPLVLPVDDDFFPDVGTIMSGVKKWLEQNYNLVDKIIFRFDKKLMYDRLTRMMSRYFPVYEVNIPEGKLPAEIRSKGSRAIQIYKKALSDGKHAVQNIRVMLVGHSGVGKTTLLKRLLGQDVDIKKIESTEGIEVHVHRCKIDVESGQWHCQDKAPPHPNAALLSAILPLLTVTPQEPILQPVQDISPEFDTSPITEDEDIHGRQQNVTGGDMTIASEPESDKSENTSEADVQASIVHGTYLSQDHAALDHLTQYGATLNVGKGCEVRPESSSSKSDDTRVKQQFKELMETYESSKRLSDSNFANISFWDFAGQYIFYNTHQVFLSHRTIYLLVTKLKHILDEAGPQRQDCDTKLHDTIEFWLDSIHFFCGKENHDPGVPPVILVATHCDKIDQAHKEKLIHNHFQNIRDIFANKITAEHIVDDLEFAVDNSVKDPELEELKKAILDVAKTQYYWQEEHPVRWLTLEKELFVKGNSGEKVLRLKAVKDINRMLPFPLEETELELFLQFQSDLVKPLIEILALFVNERLT